MESHKNMTEQGKSTASGTLGGSHQSSSTGAEKTGSHAASAPQKAREVASQVTDTVGNAYDQTVKTVSEAYDKTSEAVSNTYNKTLTYGRENPGKITLIALGAGIGIGLLLANGRGRSRVRNFAEPVVAALSQIALEYFK
ncbi:MAG: hypothetical protein DMF61_02925 [Blastocatellia bacterium AA13]|nr:MAG: hypothetical protein DMF61_02925 [Blastocatellia bacterium AA13]